MENLIREDIGRKEGFGLPTLGNVIEDRRNQLTRRSANAEIWSYDCRSLQLAHCKIHEPKSYLRLTTN